LTEDSKPHAGVPHGETLQGEITDSKVYPGTVNRFQVYVPAQYSPNQPACLLLKLDGFNEGVAVDNLIAKGDMPITIAVGIVPGSISRENSKTTIRYNRSYEFDSTNENFPDYVLNELMPRVGAMRTKDGRPLRISHAAKDRAVTGGSTGGIGSFTLAWRRPDSFSRVYSVIGTFVSMRGGDEYHSLVRKTEPKPIRIFLEDGSVDSWNPIFGSWFAANQNMESALNFAGYDVQHAWGTHGHNGKPGSVIFPDVMRWLWRDWPKPVVAGVSGNNMLKEILPPGETWQVVAEGYQGITSLASNAQGEVYFGDAAGGRIYSLSSEGKPAVFADQVPALAGEAFGPDGGLFAVAPATNQILAWDKAGTRRAIAVGFAGNRIVAAADGALYVTEPGRHTDEPSTLWRVAPDGAKVALDHGLAAASGLAFSPDHALLFAAEAATQWIYSYVAQTDGTFIDKERFYWLHQTDIPNDSGAEELAADREGTLYVATRMGVQVCDRNGRVRAILPLPSPAGPAQSLCWGGPAFDRLYVTDGHRIFSRRLLVPGYSQWAAPITLPPNGAG